MRWLKRRYIRYVVDPDLIDPDLVSIGTRWHPWQIRTSNEESSREWQYPPASEHPGILLGREKGHVSFISVDKVEQVRHYDDCE